MKTWNKRQLEKGNCRTCGKKREPEKVDRTRCLACAKKQTEYARTRRPLTREKILEYNRRHYKKNREKCLKAASDWRQKARMRVYNKYGGAVCSCCGEHRLPFLTLDHINNDGHKTRGTGATRSGGSTYLWAIRNNFPPTLRVLCYNCNSGRFRNGGICPHEEERNAKV